MPGSQISNGNRVNRCILRLPSIRTILTVSKLADFAARNGLRAVVPARDPRCNLLFREIKLVLFEGRMQQQIRREWEDAIKISLQARQRERR